MFEFGPTIYTTSPVVGCLEAEGLDNWLTTAFCKTKNPIKAIQHCVLWWRSNFVVVHLVKTNDVIGLVEIMMGAILTLFQCCLSFDLSQL